MLILRLIFVIVLGSAVSVFAYHENPYEVLHVKFNSPLTEIRDAYKRLVKIWHPDKNEHKNKQEAEEKFRKINEAYQELLKLHKQPVTVVGNKNHPFFPFAFDFSYSSAVEFLTQLSINFVEYKYVYLPRSSFVPILFYIYTDRCLLCFEHVPVLNQLKTALEPFRIPLKTVHFARDPSLARKLNYYTIPSLVVLIDGKPLPFKDALNYFKITEFIKQRLPFPLIEHVELPALADFVQIENGDNFVRAIFVQHAKPIRFQYYIMAYAYRNRYRFAFVANKSQSDATDTILVYNEHKNKQLMHPVVDLQISKSEPSFDLLFDTFDANQFLLLPRLSSRNFFDNLCPSSSPSMRKICLVLLVNSGPEDRLAVDEYRQFSYDFKKVITPKSSKLQFAYIYMNKQEKFLQNFETKKNHSQVLQPFVILALTRFDDQKGLLQFVRFSHLWQPDSMNFSDTKFAFYEFIDELLTFKMNFTSSTQFANDFNDEHLLPILRKIAHYLHYVWFVFSEDLSVDHVLVTTSIAVTILFILLIAYLMHYLAKMEEKKINEKFKQNLQKESSVNANNSSNSTNTSSGVFSSSQVSSRTTPELKLHELRIERYNGLVRLLKPGCRTIILIVDLKSRMQLIPQFHKVIWPYRKNKCLMFAHMAVERGLGWYRELLQLALPEKCDLKINPRNCVGTVLSLNGYRKYFCMFHAKHPETSHSEKKFMRLRNVRIHNIEKGKNYSYNSKYDSDTDDDANTNYLIENELLKDLPNWLDRLFEGTTQRYFVNYWPEFTAK